MVFFVHTYTLVIAMRVIVLHVQYWAIQKDKDRPTQLGPREL